MTMILLYNTACYSCFYALWLCMVMQCNVCEGRGMGWLLNDIKLHDNNIMGNFYG
jgi:hypothetical protein